METNPVKIKFKEKIIQKKKVKNYWVDNKNCILVKEELLKLQNEDIIKKGESKFISPGFIIKKKNNEIRLVIDYRE